MLSTSKVVFKDYNPKENLLFPPNLSELIDEKHPVKIVSDIIDGLDIKSLIKTYKPGGTSCYHPKMLLKVLIYGYLSNIYSSRKMEQSLKENIHFMWLSAMSRPDHNTINRFRSQRLKGEIKAIFTQIVLLLEKEGLVSLETIFVDGTKIEANANRYTFVWGKAIKKHKERIAGQLEELWNYAEKVAKDELQDTESIDFKEIDSEKINHTITKINEVLRDKKVPSKVRQKLNYAKKNWANNLDRYKNQQEILNNRNSYSKTDTDATFMRMKEDHMQNGQLKPAYNLQISTNKQFILHYSIHPNPTDTKTLGSHLQGFEESYRKVPKELVADAGYGSEENYNLLKSNKIKAYVKYNYFRKDQKSGQIPTSQNNPKLAKIREKIFKLLCTKKGIRLRKQRCHDVEPVFAQLKHNKNFKRFMLRGKTKVEVEIGILAIAHNLKKMAKAA
ncbi:IS1182 family transposase [Chryseobacterium carnipullorum]|uniref:IS1182 family transposase n=1 Tax=Chryseobacterium carnipullorum TaxID=1124835 RepID=UPI000E9F6A12|nr:IS1182 family transposase [Chryseobacterium carnipullorum]HBV14899.1 IS1182 family transposase [Chryseobacterium carnipullorum]